jgi:hypothetical protein
MPAVIIDRITRTWISDSIVLPPSQKRQTLALGDWPSDTRSPGSGNSPLGEFQTRSQDPSKPSHASWRGPNISHQEPRWSLDSTPSSFFPSLSTPALCTRSSISLFHIDTSASCLPTAGPDYSPCLLQPPPCLSAPVLLACPGPIRQRRPAPFHSLRLRVWDSGVGSAGLEQQLSRGVCNTRQERGKRTILGSPSSPPTTISTDYHLRRTSWADLSRTTGPGSSS